MKKAIERLMSYGMTETEATSEFWERVNCNLRGTGYTEADREYAIRETVDYIIEA